MNIWLQWRHSVDTASMTLNSIRIYIEVNHQKLTPSDLFRENNHPIRFLANPLFTSFYLGCVWFCSIRDRPPTVFEKEFFRLSIGLA